MIWNEFRNTETNMVLADKTADNKPISDIIILIPNLREMFQTKGNIMQTKTLLFIPLIVAVLGGINQPAEARIKCWTNKEGVRECGESVPPEYAQKGHQELSDQGMVVEEQERAKTKEELEEEARQAAIEAEERRKEEEKARQDRVLLQTFSKVADIELVRNEQLGALEANIKVTESRNEKIQQDLDKRIAQAAAEERAGNTPNKHLLKDIESLRRQLNTNIKFIADKQKEKETIKKEYDDKISRFKKLRGIE